MLVHVARSRIAAPDATGQIFAIYLHVQLLSFSAVHLCVFRSRRNVFHRSFDSDDDPKHNHHHSPHNFHVLDADRHQEKSLHQEGLELNARE